MRKPIAIACAASVGACSLVFDLDRFDRGGPLPTDASADHALADVTTPPQPPGDAGDDASDGGTDADVCHDEIEPNEDPTHASSVVRGKNCGSISTAGDVDVWEWDQVGSGTFTTQSSASLHYDINGPGTTAGVNGTGPQSKPVDTGHWEITIFSPVGGTATYTITLQ